MPRGALEYADRDEVFTRILANARKGECQYYAGTDARGRFIIEAEQWNRHCLGYPAVRHLQLASDSERLGASVFRYICLYARKGYRHNRTVWARQIPGGGEMKEFGISVSEFSADRSVRRRFGLRRGAHLRPSRAEDRTRPVTGHPPLRGVLSHVAAIRG